MSARLNVGQLLRQHLIFGAFIITFALFIVYLADIFAFKASVVSWAAHLGLSQMSLIRKQLKCYARLFRSVASLGPV